MRRLLAICSLVPLIAQCTSCANVVLSNDDGWAEKNVRTFYKDLVASGDSVVLAAPAKNRSGTGTYSILSCTVEEDGSLKRGTGSSDAPATPLVKPCEFNSCPAGSPAEGHDASNPRLNYVNSFPVTSMRYGIQNLAPKYFAEAPDIAVAGPNVGGPSITFHRLVVANVNSLCYLANLGSTVLISGTVGAATEAAKEGIPAIAFSGTTGSQISYTSAQQTYILVYSDLSTNVTQTLAATNKPYLPSNIWLNVNYPAVSGSTCSSLNQFKFVLSRINSAGFNTAADVNTCGSTRLPTESTVVKTSGCYASISVGVATTKGDASAAQQAVVLSKLGKILSCLPQK